MRQYQKIYCFDNTFYSSIIARKLSVNLFVKYLVWKEPSQLFNQSTQLTETHPFLTLDPISNPTNNQHQCST